MNRNILLLFALCLGAGCARFEYVLIEPSETERVVGERGLRVRIEPMEYQIEETGQGSLAIAIVNPGTNMVRLVSDQSLVVDPRGESHPISGRPIAPGSYVTMFLPPPPITYEARPAFSFGFGYGPAPFYHSRAHWNFGMGLGSPPSYGGYYSPFYDPFFDTPTYYNVYTPDHWGWETGRVRLHLLYESGPGNSFAQELEFLRRRVEEE